MVKINKKQLAEEIQANKSRMAIENMGFKDSAPPLISIVGPSQSGKTVLLKSMIKKLWRKDKEFTGLLTLKIGRKRYSFYEAVSTIENCIDTIKVSDLIIFVINLEVGIQKDTLEALTMMNSIGVPKFLFALTHYDKKSSNKTVDEVTKRLQKEFSFPIKHFCFEIKDKLYHNIDKIVRQIEVMKYRPVEWKCTHPYVVVDNYRDGYAYGFLRGGPIGNEVNVHVPGFGDFSISKIEILKDPCPLDSKANIFYNQVEDFNDEMSQSSVAEILEFDNDEIKMFENENNDKIDYDESISNESDHSAMDALEINKYNNEYSKDSEISYDESSQASEPHSSNDYDSKSLCHSEEEDFQALKDSVKSRFLQTAETEEDLIEKFNDEFVTKQKSDLNILETLKKKELKSMKDIENTEGLIVPGKYLKLKINLPDKLDFTQIIVIGVHLPSENVPTVLKGQIIKNKWQKAELKSNDPYLISIGWFRIQTIPMFVSNGTLISRCKKTSDILFYAPTVAAGTSFLIFDPEANYHIMATGSILDISGNHETKRRIKLIGHPKSISGLNSIVQSMFSSQKEAEKFLNAKVETASGLRGLIKSAIGKDGSVRVSFEGTILMSDIVILKCFVPILPIKYFQNLTPKSKLVQRQIVEKEEEIDSEDSEIEEYEDEYLKSRNSNNLRKIKDLESKLSYSSRKVKNIEESLNLPIPPEQKKAYEIRTKIETRRKEHDLNEKALQQKRIEKIKAKKASEALEKEEYKRKSAVKSHLERKKHKKSKKK